MPDHDRLRCGGGSIHAAFREGCQTATAQGLAQTTVDGLFDQIQGQEPCGIPGVKSLRIGGDRPIVLPFKRPPPLIDNLLTGSDGPSSLGKAKYKMTITLAYDEDKERVEDLVMSLFKENKNKLVLDRSIGLS
ncbi:hypothetical protein SI65_06637 [Aspergillus cristatus]|uniref:Uncharacterized protein n=1 Tax=Aspergillus cristatus TaxID=573508 RepID=A0A1E3BA88_ASPCR|nr:hypothetical protein SI65_06637 [Aspergillus cristatus]